MDEPFGAVDPVARDRLQAEFLRLQEQVRKTVVFVTHDIDEAIRLGDRIAVMREGGRLEQYADPATLLSSPATDFVADFVGSDRTLRRLSVLDVDVGRATAWPVVPADVQVSDAAAAMDRAEADWAVVGGSAGHPPRWIARTATTAKEGSGRTVAEIAVPAGVTRSGESVERALAALLAHEGPGVIVVDGDGAVGGVLTSGALLAGARRTPQRVQPLT
jgi:osmoprotectant transport system ATP-binding protein